MNYFQSGHATDAIGRMLSQECSLFSLPLWRKFQGKPLFTKHFYQRMDLDKMKGQWRKKILRCDLRRGYSRSTDETIQVLFRLQDSLYCYADEAEFILFAPTEPLSVHWGRRG